jgi:hypothetical protein
VLGILVSASSFLSLLKLTTITGMCIRAGSAENCYISASTTSDVLLSRLQSSMNITGVDAEVAGLLPTALSLQGNIFLPLLAAAGALFMLGLIFFALFNWTSKRATATSTGSSTNTLQIYKKILMTSLWSSVGLAIASAVSITETSAALQFWTVDVPRSNILVSSGTGMQVLQWFVASLSVLFTLAVTFLISASEAGTLPGPGGIGFPQKPAMGGGRHPTPLMGPAGGAPR